MSVGTVSRVINNAQHVSEKARQAVERAVAELGYVPNVAARSLATQRRGAVVLAISSDDPALFANLFFAEVITGVNAVIEETDLELLLVLAASERGPRPAGPDPAVPRCGRRHAAGAARERPAGRRSPRRAASPSCTAAARWSRPRSGTWTPTTGAAPARPWST